MFLENLITLGFLVLLQAVLGFDNLLYISLESRRAPERSRAMVRRTGIALAVVLRIALLFILIRLINLVREPFFDLDTSWIAGAFNLHSAIVLAGGVFIMYTAMKEIWHMLGLEEAHQTTAATPRSVAATIAWIVAMNVVFSFDSILSAMALTRVFWVMAAAIVIGGLMMIWLADGVASFLEKNRMYEVLGLFILFIVGIMLLSEGGHLAHLLLFGHEITAMSKATFYFVITVLVLTDFVQSRYQRKLASKSKPQSAATTPPAQVPA